MADESQKKPTKTTQKSTRTKEAILGSAREAFLKHGYDGVGVRDICKGAGVNAALVNRYFGSKLGLFKDVLADQTDYSELFAGPLGQLGDRLAEFVVVGLIVTESGAVLNVKTERILMFIRSVGSPEAVPALRDHLYVTLTARLVEVMPEPNSREKAAIIISYLFGFVLINKMVSAECMKTINMDVVRKQLAQSIQAVIDHNSNE